MATAFEEPDLRLGLKDGGQEVGAFSVARGGEEFAIHVRYKWARGRCFRIIRIWSGSSGDKTFRNPQSAWRFVRKFDFHGRVTVYPAGDPEFRQFVGVSPNDLGESVHLVPAAVADGARPPSAHYANPE